GRHAEITAFTAVDEKRHVVLVGDVARPLDEHGAHDVPLDVHAENLLGLGRRVLGIVGELDTAGLAATADPDLRLDDDAAAELGGNRAGLVRRARDAAFRNSDAVACEQLLRLVLE